MVITFSHIICSHISTTYHSVFVSKASRRRALLEGGLVDSELHSLSVFLAMARKGLSHEELLAALQDISGNESGSDCGLGEDSDSSSDEEPFLLTNHSIPSSESDSDVPDTRLEDSSAPPQQDLRKNTIEHEKRKLLEGSRGRAVRGSRGRRGIGAVRRATSLRGHLKSRGSRGGYVMTTALDTTDSQMCLPRGKESEGENGIGTILYAADGSEWRVVPPNEGLPGRLARQNVFVDRAGPTAHAKRFINETCSSAWRLIIDEKILRIIKNCTETEARMKLGDQNWSVTLEELDAFLGIFYLRGVLGAKSLPIKSLWSVKWGLPLCKAAMSRDRFQEILRFLRFDIKSTRPSRLATDKFALISEVWSNFIENSQACYIPGPYVTIDEQLFPTKARCPFLQFMSSKPDKYGQKFWLAVDKDKKYIINAFPYLGKDDSRPNDMRLGDHVVLQLISPYLGKGRNITCDSFFTSLYLAETLRSKNTSVVGTINRSRREIPSEIKTCRMQLHETRVLKKDNVTLTVYQGKKNKNVLIVSTMHPNVTVNLGSKHKPETVLFYNENKYGVDIVDQMARLYSVKPAARRWPLHTFSNILDLAGINAWILFREVNNCKISRRKFLLTLVEELTAANTLARQGPSQIEDDDNLCEASAKRKKCQVRLKCKKDAKGFLICKTCRKHVCNKCIFLERKVVTCVGCQSN
ncbi:uncharacterized protein LOC124161088 [Ischnura elegans]|uniref:uncharacterized protein LOC124156831 n=1 Tax=Ischnura elegans TaxID=197161 RepID=UPI001ED89864|nr:uncharacterized protein LOC124156831 [Ischnura elegans]XP_046393240.1 uncharacterized protein LOC124161088 [Ischnura elegans]